MRASLTRLEADIGDDLESGYDHRHRARFGQMRSKEAKEESDVVQLGMEEEVGTSQ